MVRKLGIKEAIQPTEKRAKAVKLRQRKLAINPFADCFWTSTEASSYLDDDVLADL